MLLTDVVLTVPEAQWSSARGVRLCLVDPGPDPDRLMRNAPVSVTAATLPPALCPCAEPQPIPDRDLHCRWAYTANQPAFYDLQGFAALGYRRDYFCFEPFPSGRRPHDCGGGPSPVSQVSVGDPCTASTAPPDACAVFAPPPDLRTDSTPPLEAGTGCQGTLLRVVKDFRFRVSVGDAVSILLPQASGSFLGVGYIVAMDPGEQVVRVRLRPEPGTPEATVEVPPWRIRAPYIEDAENCGPVNCAGPGMPFDNASVAGSHAIRCPTRRVGEGTGTGAQTRAGAGVGTGVDSSAPALSSHPSDPVKPRLKCWDLFAGAGGFSCGLEACRGLQTVVAVECSPIASQTFQANHPQCAVYQTDIWEFLRHPIFGRPPSAAPCHPEKRYLPLKPTAPRYERLLRLPLHPLGHSPPVPSAARRASPSLEPRQCHTAPRPSGDGGCGSAGPCGPLRPRTPSTSASLSDPALCVGQPTAPDVIISGPPCVAYSRLNRFRRPDDPSVCLLAADMALMERALPAYHCVENVPAILDYPFAARSPGLTDGVPGGAVLFLVVAGLLMGYQVHSPAPLSATTPTAVVAQTLLLFVWNLSPVWLRPAETRAVLDSGQTQWPMAWPRTGVGYHFVWGFFRCVKFRRGKISPPLQIPKLTPPHAYTELPKLPDFARGKFRHLP